MKTKIEIIEETAKFYSEDTSRRSSKNDACFYHYPGSGKECAIGRCAISSFELQKFSDSIMENSEYVNIFQVEGLFEDYLKPEYRGHKSEFWVSLQAFHDNDEYWNKNGMTEKGELRKEALLKRYNA